MQNVRGNVRWCLSALAAGTLTAHTARAQTEAPPPAGAAPAQSIKMEDLPPSIRLGARVASVRAKLPVVSAVVIAPDARAYTAAIGSWSLRGRFPVLIDDGSWASREAIARFVRAFRPEKVVRVKASPPPAGGEADLCADVERAVAAAWECADPARLADHWKGLSFVPPGIVIAHPSDPAWTGALALAAGHGQPILWLNARPWGVNLADWHPLDKLEELRGTVHAELRARPWKWESLGDDIEAVTLCQSGPVKVHVGEPSMKTVFAVTDVLGRPSGALTRSPTDPGRGERWAWAGQVVGNEWQAACMAMSSLFLTPDRAWLFDGYDDSPPWNGWDATAAADLLRQAGIGVLLDDGERRGVDDWRRRGAGLPRGGDPGFPPRDQPPAGLLDSRRGVDAGLVFVNSSGNADFFDLKPGQGKPDDVPFLRVPAAVHFVHSWSATNPLNRDTVAGRWLEHGAFAYVGSTYEPYLQSFVPTPVVAQRMLLAMPIGAAARIDNAEPWKLAVIGDPLFVLSRPMPRTGGRLPDSLGPVEELGDALGEQLKAERFAEALDTLRMTGRDEEAARVIAAMLKDRPDAVTADVAVAGLGPAFFELSPAVFAKVYAAALPRIVADPALAACRDMIWHAAAGRGTQLSPEEVDLLAQSLRPGCLVRDAGEAARLMERTRGAAAARSVIERAKSMAPDDATRKEVAKWAP